MGDCDADQAIKMFKHVYGEENLKEKEISKSFNNIKCTISPAKLQNHLLKYKHHPEQALENILQLRQDEAEIFEEDRTTIYRCTSSYDQTWMPTGKGKLLRPWNTIITQNNIKEEILKDINDFLDSKEIYRELGINHRKGYLLYGPPGTGKSTLIAGLADKLRYNICVIEFGNQDITDSGLMTQLSTLPSRSIVIIEDIDVALPSMDRRLKIQKEKEKRGDYSSSSRVTLSGVLNALDGICTASPQIVFMTSNHIDDLDQALVRPGR